MNSEHIDNIRFADDIAITADSVKDIDNLCAIRTAIWYKLKHN